MTASSREEQELGTAALLRAEVEGWQPRRGPDLADLTRRGDRSWLQPIITLSAAGASALAVVFVLALMIVIAPPPLPLAEAIKTHLLAR
jgi:hypothetical protein